MCITFHVKHTEYSKKQYHQKQFSKGDFTWPYLFFLHGSIHSSQLLQQKGKEANGKHQEGEAQTTPRASFQGSLSRGLTENGPAAAHCVCSVVFLFFRERLSAYDGYRGLLMQSLSAQYISRSQKKGRFSSYTILSAETIQSQSHRLEKVLHQ